MIKPVPGRSSHTVRSAIRPSASPSPIDVRTAVIAFVGAWVVAQFATALVLTVFGETGEPSTVPIGVLAVALVATWSTYIAAMWNVSERAGTADPIADFGISVRTSDVLGLGIGVLAQLVVVRLVYLPLERLWPDTFTEEQLRNNAEDLADRAGGLTTLLLFVLVVVGAPVCEELFYRGLLQRSLLARFNDTLVVVGVAAIFALIHLRPVEYPGLFVFGLIVGAAARLTGRLGMPIMIHIGFNATGLMLVL